MIQLSSVRALSRIAKSSRWLYTHSNIHLVTLGRCLYSYKNGAREHNYRALKSVKLLRHHCRIVET